MTKEDLIAFEDDISATFNAGQIKAPVHLARGNEDQLIELFKSIEPHDWVVGTWRTHYHCLLKGVPPEQLKSAIVAGRSIALCFREYKIISSAMVGGNAPIALGIAWGIKRRGGSERVHCFMGDMGWETGIVRECVKYANGHSLPIRWIIEDNGRSVDTITLNAWGRDYSPREMLHYTYRYDGPHVGTGQWVCL